MSADHTRRLNPAAPARERRARSEPHAPPLRNTDAELFGRAASRPEGELLLLCARSVTGAAAPAGRVRELARAPLDWDWLVRLARRHSVLPLLHRGLEAKARGDGPPELVGALRDECRASATRGMLLAGELSQIVGLFETEGVPVLAYKGPALAVQAYGELALRRFVDLDLIVRRGDARRAGGLLQSLGYRKPKGLTESHEEFLLRRQHNLAFARDGGALIAELHWEVAPAPFASLPVDEAVWARAVPVGLFGREVKSLSPEDLLVALCVHGTKHLWGRLSWVCDVAALLNSHPNLDWSFVLRRAGEARVERMLCLGLRLAAGLLCARVPENLPVGRCGAQVGPPAVEVTKNLFGAADYEPPGLLRSTLFNLRLRPGAREKVGFLRFIFTPTDGDLTAVRLPPALSFLYYVLRPFRLALKREAAH